MCTYWLDITRRVSLTPFNMNLLATDTCFSDDFLRVLNRSDCGHNFTFSLFSISLQYTPLCCADAEESTPFDKFMFTTVSFIPVIVLVPIILLFNFNLASGPKQAFVFFFQCLPLTSPISYSFNPGMFYIWSSGGVGDIVTLHSPVEVLFWPRTSFTAPYRILEYNKIFFAILSVLLVLFLVKCSWCPLQKCRLPWAKTRRAVRNFREKHVPNSTILQGICSVVVLVYGNLVATSFTLLLKSEEYCISQTKDCPRLCVDLPYDSQQYTLYIAVSSSVLLLLLPLIYYPTIPALFHKLTKRSLPRFPKLDPVFDVFQGVYKDKMRWFAGLHFFYIYILWGINAFVNGIWRRQFYLLCTLAIITATQSALQPFKKKAHNYIQTLILLNLVLQAILSRAVPCFSRISPIEAFIFVIVIITLGVAPTVVVIVVCVRRLVRLYLVNNKVRDMWRKCKMKIFGRGSGLTGEEDQEDNYLGERLEYFVFVENEESRVED